MLNRRAGFTLIEVLLASGLAAIISAAILVPMIYTLSALEQTQYEFGRESDSDNAVIGIYRELRASSPEASFHVLKIENKSSFTIKEDGRLLLWTTLISKEGRPAGGIAYRIIKDPENKKSGLYRWILQPSEMTKTDIDNTLGNNQIPGPLDIDIDSLLKENGKLVIRDAEGIVFNVKTEGKWVNEYNGNIPNILRISVLTKGKRRLYEEVLPLSL